MKQEEFLQLAERISSGHATDADIARYNSWYNSYSVNQAWNEAELGAPEEKEAELFQAIAVQISRSKVTRLWPRVIGVAAAVAAIVFGIWFYTSSPIVNRNSKIVVQNDVAPGKNRATLTLANGKVINLSDSKTGVSVDVNALTYNDGSPVERGDADLRQDDAIKKGSGNIAMLTAATLRGGTYQITLPDGTKVWLNAASTIKFPSTFSGLANRKVTLSGEAYFEVFRNKKQPFVVNAKKMELTVLGTHFNVSAYQDEVNTKATLLEGSVRVMALTRPHPVILKPNQQALLKGNENIAVKQVDPGEVLAWKEGDFVFRAEPLEDVMRALARWYDIEVVYTADAPKTEPFSGAVSRLRNISVVLERMESTGSVKFKIEGKRITVMK